MLQDQYFKQVLLCLLLYILLRNRQPTYLDFQSNPGEESLNFFMEIYNLIIFHQFFKLNFFPVANNRWEYGVNYLLIKLQHSIFVFFLWRLAKEIDIFLNFCLQDKSIELLRIESKLEHSALVSGPKLIT